MCNHVFYGLMDLLARAGSAARGGFIHVPFSTPQAEAHQAPGLPVGEMAAALVIIARASAVAGADARVPAGAEH